MAINKLEEEIGSEYFIEDDKICFSKIIDSDKFFEFLKKVFPNYKI